jgi:tRNA pseudouridine38-40 synthase
MRGVLLTVAYDGRPFAGFAPQSSQRTVAGELLGAVQALDPRVGELRGASRTDAGVHAHGQRVAFDSESAIPTKGWVLGISRHLPPEIAVRRAARVETGFSPRFGNRGKRYRYLILRDVARDPFFEGRAWRVADLRGDAALGRATTEAALAVGTHDFAAFRSSADVRHETVRTIRSIELHVDPADERVLRVDVYGDAFLHNMVRILIGTIADVARGRLQPGAIGRALISRDRRDAGITAPAAGLYLVQVTMVDEGTDAWPEPWGDGEEPAASEAHEAEDTLPPGADGWTGERRAR